MNFELSVEETKIVEYLLEDKWVSDDDANSWKRFDHSINQLQSPEALFAFCVNFNFDCGVNELLRVLHHELMDKGTVLALYWIMGPGYFMRYESRSDVEEHELEQLEAIETVEKRLQEVFNSNTKIYFNPRDYQNYDWTTQYKGEMEKLEKVGKKSFFSVPQKYYAESTRT